ncbi:zf-HC2 domain-containing protein [Candidatus Parcubacteria bacterium]|nr:MAG: zf-HC2 domain-containing protein [Candidatus Parcubacteria bacterium]
MATCKQIYDNMYSYLDGDLTSGQKHTVDNHIKKCKNCKTYLHNCETVNHILELMKDIPMDNEQE